MDDRLIAVRFVDVVRKFGEVAAVNGVNLDIYDGEFFTMLGPSGSGKTTCLRMIAGLFVLRYLCRQQDIYCHVLQKGENMGYIRGIDVSAYDPYMDWQKVRNQEIRFAVIKSTEGVGYISEYFNEQWAGAKSVGILRGSYHYLRAAMDGVQQADFFLTKVDVQDGDLPPFLDIEGANNDGATNSQFIGNAQKWLERVEAKTGRRPIVYSTASFLQEKLTGNNGKPPPWAINYQTAFFAGSGGAEASDWITIGQVALPVGQQWRNMSWGLEYSLSHEKHQDFDVLDHTDHLVRLDFGAEPSPRSSFSLGASYNKTQLQGNTASLESQDLFLVGRANRDVYRFDLAFRREQTPRWRWDLGVNGNSYRYRRITEVAEVISPVPLEDRREYEGFWGLSRALTKATALGGEYRFRFFDLSVSGNESAHLISVIVDHNMPHRLSVSCRMGVSLATTETTSTTAQTVSARRTGVQGSIDVRRFFTVNVGAGDQTGDPILGVHDE